MPKLQVTKAAFDRIDQALRKELGAAQLKLRRNRDMIDSLAKEQRTLKSEVSGLFAMLRDLHGKPPRVSKKHRKKEEAQ